MRNMKPRIEILAGIAGSGKTTELLSSYRDALRLGIERIRLGTTLWLSPTHRAKAEVRDRLLDGSLPVVFRPNLATFDDFAEQVLAAAPRSVAPLSPAMQRILLRRIVADLARRKQLPHFEKIAGTSGFLDLVAAFISELKRSETWPEHFIEACARRNTRPRDRELGLIYARYQQALGEGNVYDGEGRFWSAREALAAGEWGRFADLSFVVVDGFTDFTEAQYRILELLARKVDRLRVSLLTEAPLVRTDLFGKSAAVIERLQKAAEVDVRWFPAVDSPSAAGSSALPATFGHLARHLFTNPREITRADDAQGIEVVAVAGQVGEVNLLASRLKQLLLEGIAPGEIVVAIRDLDGYAALIDEIFFAAGIPFACEAGLPLSRLVPFKALVNLLALELEDWPFRRLMGLPNCGAANSTAVANGSSPASSARHAPLPKANVWKSNAIYPNGARPDAPGGCCRNFPMQRADYGACTGSRAGRPSWQPWSVNWVSTRLCSTKTRLEPAGALAIRWPRFCSMPPGPKPLPGPNLRP
jgi:ATP-dependent helicase/DNAse subunit B